jgi:hypothetical protein
MTRLADEAAAIHLFSDGAPISMAEIRDHIRGCDQCGTANPGHVWHILTSWRRGINRGHVHGARR